MSYNASLTGAGWLVDPIINPKSGTPSAPYIATLNQDGWNVQPIVKPVAPPAFGPELMVNSEFDSGGTGWSVTGNDATHIITFAAGTARFQSDTTSPQMFLMQNGILTAGKLYEATIVISSWTSGTIKSDFLGTSGSPGISSAGRFTRRGNAIGPNYGITRGAANTDMTIDSISVKEVL